MVTSPYPSGAGDSLRRPATRLALAAALVLAGFAIVFLLWGQGEPSNDLSPEVAPKPVPESSESGGLGGRGSNPQPAAAQTIEIRGTVVSLFSGIPISGAKIVAEPNYAAVTGVRGHFVLGVPRQDQAHRVRVRATHAGFLPVAVAVVLPSAGIAAHLRLRLQPTTQLRIKVTRGDGSPVAGARLAAWQLSLHRTLPSLVLGATTGADGMLSVAWPADEDASPARDLLVDALSPDRSWGSVRVAVPSDRVHVIKLAPPSVTVEIRQGTWPAAPPTWADVELRWQPAADPEFGVLPGRVINTSRLQQQAAEPLRVLVPPGRIVARASGFDVPDFDSPPRLCFKIGGGDSAG